MRAEKELMIGAMHEIKQLRRTNEILAAKVSVVDAFAAACGLRRDGFGVSEDIAWALEQKIQEMTTAEEKAHEDKHLTGKKSA